MTNHYCFFGSYGLNATINGTEYNLSVNFHSTHVAVIHDGTPQRHCNAVQDAIVKLQEQAVDSIRPSIHWKDLSEVLKNIRWTTFSLTRLD